MDSIAARPSGSKHELAYESIKTRIVTGVYGPGYRLVLEQLAREFGFSPVPVREAIRRLEAEGYVEFIRNVGARVAHLDTGAYRQAMEALALLEGYATALAAPRMRKTDIKRARSLNRQMEQALNTFDPAAFTELNHQFHGVILERCPNSYIRSLAVGEWARLDLARRSSFAFVPGRAGGSVLEHDHLIDLIESGADAAEIEAAARGHKLGTLHAMDRHTASGA
ncbi:GntR family transcriptional regulator [Nocardia panacis]|uniref:GntR family transcriptional regulator n=1 Tax=Nocardia panacis TaxID=2340916 RepID=A0A3A4K3I3_9NOCA|nr:GntR family transcriptional regulator [Nocardia panacis]